MKLWGHYPMYRNVRCAWLIKELGLDDKVEYKHVPVRTQSPAPAPEREEYRKKVHPHSTVPALEIEGGPTLLESAAICLYLADLCGRLAPEPKDRAEYYNWILYAASRMDESMEMLYYGPVGSAGWSGPKEQQDQQVMAKTKAVVDLCLDEVERTLQNRPFILGSELTAADCVLGYNLLWAALPALNDGILLKDRPNINAYLERIKARPALQEALAQHGQ